MSEYRRWYVPGGTCFFTLVTQDREPMFRDPQALRMLGARDAQGPREVPLSNDRRSGTARPSALRLVAAREDADYSGRWQWIKGAFTEQWLSAGGNEASTTASTARKGEHGVWQRRFWEHQIKDEVDLERHVDYIHYNPVKHGYASRPGDWHWSSFPRHVRLGQYPMDWGAVEPVMPTVRPCEVSRCINQADGGLRFADPPYQTGPLPEAKMVISSPRRHTDGCVAILERTMDRITRFVFECRSLIQGGLWIHRHAFRFRPDDFRRPRNRTGLGGVPRRDLQKWSLLFRNWSLLGYRGPFRGLRRCKRPPGQAADIDHTK